jgi:hypothetical protein
LSVVIVVDWEIGTWPETIYPASEVSAQPPLGRF